MFTLSFIDEDLIIVRLEDFCVYFAKHLPIAFKEKRDVRIRDGHGPMTKRQMETIKTIEKYSNNFIVELPKEKFRASLEEAFKRSLYNSTSKLTLKRMGINHVSEERHPRFLGDQSTRLITEGCPDDKKSA